MTTSSNRLITRLLLVVVIGAMALAFGHLSGPSGGMAGWGDYRDVAIRDSEDSGKPMLVFFTADWCSACRHFKRQVLSAASVSQRLRGAYVLAKVDLTDRNGPNTAIPSEFGVRGIPAMIFCDPTGQEIDRISGSSSPWKFLEWLDVCQAKMAR